MVNFSNLNKVLTSMSFCFISLHFGQRSSHCTSLKSCEKLVNWW